VKASKLVIAVSGLHGAGRSTHARRLAEVFGLRYVSAGKLFREFSSERHMQVHQLSEALKHNPEVDEFIDGRTREEAAKGCVVLDGDLSAWMAGDMADLRIFLTAPDQVRFKRLARRDGKAFGEMKVETFKREKDDRERYREFYGVDFLDTSIYDIVLNTANLPRESIFKVLKTLVEEYIRAKEEGGGVPLEGGVK